MNLRDFLDVRVICETRSLRKAAKLLGVTQPTLSNRIAHLESQLGASLFDRTRGQSNPTELALFISQRATGFTLEAQRLATELKRVSSGKAGLVRIGLSAAAARVQFPDIAVEVSGRYPDVSLEMRSAPTVQLANDLVDRELDLLVCPALDQAHESIESELLIETDIVVLARPDHPLCADPPRTIAGLFKYPIALPIAEPHYLDRLKKDHGVDIDAMPGRMLCSDASTLARIVLGSSRLFTAAPRFYFEPELKAGTLSIVGTPVPFGHSLYMHWNRDAFPLPAVRTVQEMTREAFSRLRAAA